MESDGSQQQITLNINPIVHLSIFQRIRNHFVFRPAKLIRRVRKKNGEKKTLKKCAA